MIRPLAAAVLVVLPTLAPSPLVAQSRGGDGYLFERPRVTLSVRGGAARPNASGGVFDFASDLLTLSPNRYMGLSIAADLAVPVSNRAEVVVSASTNRRRVGSEYRDWVDNNDQPITQTTRLDRTPITVGLRWNLIAPGRTVSRLAWVPNRFVPYVSAGAGVMAWRFRQEGDFVDFLSESSDVFTSTLQDRGWARTAYAATGASWSLSSMVGVNGELRYDLASAPLRGDFEGFSTIGLSGVQVTAGLQFRF